MLILLVNNKFRSGKIFFSLSFCLSLHQPQVVETAEIYHLYRYIMHVCEIYVSKCCSKSWVRLNLFTMLHYLAWAHYAGTNRLASLKWMRRLHFFTQDKLIFKTYFKMLFFKRISWTYAKLIQLSVFHKLMETMFDHLDDKLIKSVSNS